MPHAAIEAASIGLASGWCALSPLHGCIETYMERALRGGHDLSAREYSLLDVRSQSATTRTVIRLQNRGLVERYLWPIERRGVCADVTAAGMALLAEAPPMHDAVEQLNRTTAG